MEKSDGMSELKAKLKTCGPDIQNYVTALNAKNLKFQRQIGQLQAEIDSLNNRIKILEEEESKPIINVVKFGDHENPS